MKEVENGGGQRKLFAILLALGLVAEFTHVHIPHTDALIDGRWAFGFMGFALLRRGWAALLLAGLLSLPLGSRVPFWIGLSGNLLYALPALLTIRPLAGRLRVRWGSGWGYGLGWLVLVLFCYQAYTTPAVWGVLALREGRPVGPHLLAGWQTQPFLIESILVALFSATAMVAFLTLQKLRRHRRRLDHLNRVLLGIRSVNQLIVSEDDPQRLIEKACVHLTETLGYSRARIVLLDAAAPASAAGGTGAEPAARADEDAGEPSGAWGAGAVLAGAAAGFAGGVAELPASMLRGELPSCMRRALGSDAAVAMEEPEVRCSDCPLSSEDSGRAGLSRRLACDGRTYGVLAVSVPTAYIHDIEEQDLFHEVAGDLAFALHKIETARALRESQRRYLEIFERSREGFVIVNPAGRILEANQAYCDMLGYTIEELRALEGFPDLTPERWREWEVTEIWEKRLLGQGHSGLYEKEYTRKDGTVIPVELRAYAVCREDGAIDYLWSTVRDLTHRKQQEERIALLGSMLDEAPASITIYDTQGRFLFANQATVALHGYAGMDEFLAINLHELDVPESEALLAERFRRIAEHGEARFESAHYRKNGSTFPLEILAKQIEWHGQPAILSIATDITERKRAEDELRKRESQLQRTFEILPVGLWFADKDGTLQRGNPAGVRIWGAEPCVPVAEFGVFKARRLPSGEPVQAEEWALARTIREGATIVDELLEIEAFDGQKRIILNYSAPILDEKGNVDGAIVVNLDISDRKALEEQLAQAQKMESVGRLAGGVAHDFNNMLSVILGHVELLLSDLPGDGALRTNLLEIQRAAQRSANLTRQLMAFARRQTIAPEVLDLNETIESMLTMIGRLIGEQIDVLWKPGRKLPPVCIDPAQIDQLVANLCVNARDAVGHGVGQVTIETAEVGFSAADCIARRGFLPGRYVMLAVSDDGCGMDEETKANIFEPFFTTKGIGEGTGLGLATVYGIVKQNRGLIDVSSEPGTGTIFRIYLPVHEAGGLPAPQEPRRAESWTPGDETILLVEDEPAILKMTRMMLERQGYTVLAAATPSAALHLAEAHPGSIDLLVTDVVMPEMNGRELANALAARHPGLGRLFMSGHTADVIAHHGVLDEGVSFLQKPFSQNDLAVQVRELLEREDDRPSQWEPRGEPRGEPQGEPQGEPRQAKDRDESH